MNRKLINYLPYVVREYGEFQGITQAQQPEFENAWAAMEELLHNQFIKTAGGLGLSRWEKLLGIIPKGTETLEDRRFRILTRLNQRIPYTLPQFQEMLDHLCGVGNAFIQLESGGYQLRVFVKEGFERCLSEIRGLTNRIIPVNLAFLCGIQMNPVVFANSNDFYMKNLTITGHISNWFQRPVTFRGEEDFDGEIQWDQMIFARSALALRIGAGVRSWEGGSIQFSVPIKAREKSGGGDFSARILSSPGRNRQRVWMLPFSLSSTLRTRENTSAQIICNQKFQFNGENSWEGSKKFNSGVTITI